MLSILQDTFMDVLKEIKPFIPAYKEKSQASTIVIQSDDSALTLIAPDGHYVKTNSIKVDKALEVIAIEFNALFELVSKSADERIDLAIEKRQPGDLPVEVNCLSLRCGASKSRFYVFGYPVYPKEEITPALTGDNKIAVDWLKHGVTTGKQAESRPVLSWLHVAEIQGKAAMCAANGYMALMDWNIEADSLPEWISLKGSVDLSRDKQTNAITSKFVDINAIIPAPFSQITVNSSELFAALKTLKGIGAKENPRVTLSYAEQGLILLVQSPERGNMQSIIDASGDCEPFSIDLNYAYLLAAMAGFDTSPRKVYTQKQLNAMSAKKLAALQSAIVGETITLHYTKPEIIQGREVQNALMLGTAGDRLAILMPMTAEVFHTPNAPAVTIPQPLTHNNPLADLPADAPIRFMSSHMSMVYRNYEIDCYKFAPSDLVMIAFRDHKARAAYENSRTLVPTQPQIPAAEPCRAVVLHENSVLHTPVNHEVFNPSPTIEMDQPDESRVFGRSQLTAGEPIISDHEIPTGERQELTLRDCAAIYAAMLGLHEEIALKPLRKAAWRYRTGKRSGIPCEERYNVHGELYIIVRPDDLKRWINTPECHERGRKA